MEKDKRTEMDSLFTVLQNRLKWDVHNYSTLPTQRSQPGTFAFFANHIGSLTKRVPPEGFATRRPSSPNVETDAGKPRRQLQSSPHST